MGGVAKWDNESTPLIPSTSCFYSLQNKICKKRFIFLLFAPFLISLAHTCCARALPLPFFFFFGAITKSGKWLLILLTNSHLEPTNILVPSCPTCFPHAAGMQLEIMQDLGLFGTHKDVAKCCSCHKINVCARKTATTPGGLMWYLMTYMCFPVPWRYHRLSDALAWLVCPNLCIKCLSLCVRVWVCVGIMAFPAMQPTCSTKSDIAARPGVLTALM